MRSIILAGVCIALIVSGGIIDLLAPHQGTPLLIEGLCFIGAGIAAGAEWLYERKQEPESNSEHDAE